MMPIWKNPVSARICASFFWAGCMCGRPGTHSDAVPHFHFFSAHRRLSAPQHMSEARVLKRLGLSWNDFPCVANTTHAPHVHQNDERLEEERKKGRRAREHVCSFRGVSNAGQSAAVPTQQRCVYTAHRTYSRGLKHEAMQSKRKSKPLEHTRPEVVVAREGEGKAPSHAN